MSRFFGISPQPATQHAAEMFENNVMIRKNNRYLISTVYLDMQDDRWAVAIAYNPSRNPGLHGQENILEVRYSYDTRAGTMITMIRSDPLEEVSVPTGRFSDPDSFACHVLSYERGIINRAA